MLGIFGSDQSRIRYEFNAIKERYHGRMLCARLRERGDKKRIATRLFSTIICWFALAPTAFVCAQEQMEYNIDRWGSDYKGSYLTVANPGICRSRCNADTKCKAWTYVKPGIQGSYAVCWLKNRVPVATPNNCCVSGVKGVEYGIDRWGSDYKGFYLNHADPALCRTKCNEEVKKCKAWTYVKPGFQGTHARCWLKNSVPVATSNNCCVSGVNSNTYQTGSVIGNGANIGNNNRFGTYSLFGDNLTCGDDNYFGYRIHVGNNVTIGNHVAIEKHAQVGNNVEIEDCATIKEGARLGNNVHIDSHIIVEKDRVVPNNTALINPYPASSAGHECP